MKLNFVSYLVLFFLMLGAIGCESEDSENVDQDRIYAAYELFYDETENVTYAKTTFSFGNLTGTRLELSEGASIIFNDTAIPFNNVGGFYELKLAGLVNSGTFLYTDLDGEVFSNLITLRAVNFPENIPTILDRSQSYELIWQGASVAEGASSVVATVVPNNIQQTKVFTQSNEDATSVVLGSGVLQDIDPQPGTLILERFDITEATETTSAGGLITGRYRPTVLSINIE
ncbi:hypothetical protein J8281_17780 [Aquimarina sp. U1-2]|uniref:hypothetical protein n=1 Tax=Aquimarina sp. U1-2 TaxID=2823141 RepID=UPI001AECAAFC|nr:hypothetical protein [Aquimarina sp. U1-2]MBP2834051.1 hypothetical protein [Aquimarina sp. U1-2]